MVDRFDELMGELRSLVEGERESSLAEIAERDLRIRGLDRDNAGLLEKLTVSGIDLAEARRLLAEERQYNEVLEKRLKGSEKARDVLLELRRQDALALAHCAAASRIAGWSARWYQVEMPQAVREEASWRTGAAEDGGGLSEVAPDNDPEEEEVIPTTGAGRGSRCVR